MMTSSGRRGPPRMLLHGIRSEIGRVILDPDVVHRVSAAVDDLSDEIVDFTVELIRIPTVNPPGDEYETCARLIGDRLRAFDFEVAYVTAEGRPEHTAAHPRVNVIGRAQRCERRVRWCTSTATSTWCRPATAGPSIPSAAWCATAASTGAAPAT